MAETSMSLQLTDLPLDILLLIVPYLSPYEVLAFSSISPTFYNEPQLRYAASYWRAITRDTFRVPNHPVVEGDGRRWMKMYRKMRNQTRIYGWGNDDGGCMNIEREVPQSNEIVELSIPRRRLQPGRHFPGGLYHGRIVRRRMTFGVPEILTKGDATVVADLQCGGWSTTILDSQGVLHTSGHIADTHTLQRAVVSTGRHKLQFPPEFQPPVDENKYNAQIAIKQFSSGRSHILGLADSGRIWTWDHVEHAGLHVKFLTIDLVESSKQDLSHKKGYVRKVAAGFNRSTAYIVGTGIVAWEPSNTAEIEGFSDHSSGDGMLVLESAIIPNTGYLQHSRGMNMDNSTESIGMGGEDFGEVVNYAVLESYVLFVTHIGKVFACQIKNQDLTTFQVIPRTSSTVTDDTFVVDVQGSFRSFAIMKRNGEVLTGDDSYLANMENNFNKLRKIPSLQHTGVISMAFGDYHYHALHADGTISSYGNDPQACGALGLSSRLDQPTIPRGLRRVGDFNVDLSLMENCYTSGRRVWFEPEKHLWLKATASDSSDEAKTRRSLCDDREDVCAEVSEWVEQKLLHWEDGTEPEAEDDEDELPAYFALSVAAAGWHSGALVLVDEEKATRIVSRFIACRHEVQLNEDQVAEGSSSSGATVQEVSTAEAGADDSTVRGLLASTMTAVRSSVNWFVGKPTPKRSDNTDSLRWVWENSTFPRLRLRSGEVMPGSTPIAEWTGPREWKTVENVVE